VTATGRVSDANVLAWRPVDFEDGSGRGSPEDWLASRCWPDAAETPQVAVVDGVAYYAHGGLSVALPLPRGRWDDDDSCAEWAAYETWPEAWDTCDVGRWMIWAVRDLGPFKLRVLAATLCADTVAHLAPQDEPRLRRITAGFRAWSLGEMDDDAFSVWRHEHTDNVHCPLRTPTDHVINAAYECMVPFRSIRYASQAAFAIGAVGDPPHDARCAAIIRATIPWHVVLGGLLRPRELSAQDSHVVVWPPRHAQPR
jgi:hypothetical protein